MTTGICITCHRMHQTDAAQCQRCVSAGVVPPVMVPMDTSTQEPPNIEFVNYEDCVKLPSRVPSCAEIALDDRDLSAAEIAALWASKANMETKPCDSNAESKADNSPCSTASTPIHYRNWQTV